MARSGEYCELTASTVVAQSIQTCWHLYIDNALVSQWAPAVQQVECSVAELDKGVMRTSHVIIDDKPGHTVEQCTLFDPLKRIDMAITEETFGFSHMLNSYGFSMSFNVDADQTLLILQTHYTPKKIFASLMTANATQQQLLSLMSNTLDGFKRYTESQQ